MTDLELAELHVQRLNQMLLAYDGGDVPEWLARATNNSIARNMVLLAREHPWHPHAPRLVVLARTSRLVDEWLVRHPDVELSDDEFDALWNDLMNRAREIEDE